MTKTFDVDIENQQVNIELYTQTEAALAELEEKYESKSLPDAATKDGYKFIADGVRIVSKYRTSLEKKRKEIKQPYLDAGKIIDSEAKRITARLIALEVPMKEAKAEIDKAEERAKQERIKKQEQGILAIRKIVEECRGNTAEEIEAAIEEVTANDCSTFYDLKKEALEARNWTLAELGQLLTDAIQREEMQAELRKKEMQAEIEKRMNALIQIPLDMLGSSHEELCSKIEKLTKFNPEPYKFGDRFDEMLAAKAKVITKLESLAEKARLLEQLKAQQKPKPEINPQSDIFETKQEVVAEEKPLDHISLKNNPQIFTMLCNDCFINVDHLLHEKDGFVLPEVIYKGNKYQYSMNVFYDHKTGVKDWMENVASWILTKADEPHVRAAKELAFRCLGDNFEKAEEIVTLIRAGEIPHLQFVE